LGEAGNAILTPRHAFRRAWALLPQLAMPQRAVASRPAGVAPCPLA